MSELLSGRQAARRLNVHPNTVRDWANRGLLSDQRSPGSGRRRYDAEEVEALHAGRLAAMSEEDRMRALLCEALDLLDQKDPLWRYHGYHSWRR